MALGNGEMEVDEKRSEASVGAGMAGPNPYSKYIHLRTMRGMLKSCVIQVSQSLPDKLLSPPALYMCLEQEQGSHPIT